MSNEPRIDKWLWAVRLFKTRSLAASACRDGQVLIGGQRVKPARTVHVGEMMGVKVGGVQRTVRVLAFPSSRVSAKLVPEFMEDFTPAAEYEKAREAAKLVPFSWPKGMGRPTKKDRRLWEQFGSENS
ncbi:MAG TPA: RNA-binding S4 domain-containing protein [Verrucomicrobiae bacterium]|jgi:ribosome-associated heat shock protein Hsp15